MIDLASSQRTEKSYSFLSLEKPKTWSCHCVFVNMAAEQAGAEYEAQHVHDVYEQIASHFSATRYKVRLYAPHAQPPL